MSLFTPTGANPAIPVAVSGARHLTEMPDGVIT